MFLLDGEDLVGKNITKTQLISLFESTLPIAKYPVIPIFWFGLDFIKASLMKSIVNLPQGPRWEENWIFLFA